MVFFLGNESSYEDVGQFDYRSYRKQCSKYNSTIHLPPKVDLIEKYSYDTIWTGIERFGSGPGQFTLGIITVEFIDLKPLVTCKDDFHRETSDGFAKYELEVDADFQSTCSLNPSFKSDVVAVRVTNTSHSNGRLYRLKNTDTAYDLCVCTRK